MSTWKSASRNIIIIISLALVAVLTRPASAGTAALLGVYAGNQGWNMDQVRDLEGWQGKKHAVVNMFTNWCNRPEDMDNLFSQQLLNIWNNQNVPMITWEPYLCSPDATPTDVEVRAANGAYDAYFHAWAARLKGFLSGPDGVYNTADDRRAYLRMGHEMNSDWYPWGAAQGNNTPADFIQMWRHVKGIFDGQGLGSTRLQWVWAVNNEDVGGVAAEQYYPGDAYVDWVAIDGYNWGTSQSWSNWRTPAECYDAMLGRLHTLTTKPVALTELASSTSTADGASVAAKAQWITDLFAYVTTKDIRLVAWFNEDKETDWAVFGGANGDGTYDDEGGATYQIYAAYKTAVGGASFIPSDGGNPRLLTDAQFAGQ
jgi:beta-mannanase